VRPDWEIIAEVAQNPGAIGHISFSFLDGMRDARAQADTPEPLPELPGWVRSLERLRVYGDFRLRQEADR